jgi:hypothetical protein
MVKGWERKSLGDVLPSWADMEIDVHYYNHLHRVNNILPHINVHYKWRLGIVAKQQIGKDKKEKKGLVENLFGRKKMIRRDGRL